MSRARGYTIFCDDIRREVGGKLTLVGVYRSEMLVHGKLPVRLPKLGLMIHFEAPRDQPVTHLDLMIYLPGDPDDAPSVSGEMGRIKAPQLPDAPGDVDQWLAIGTEVILSPLEIKQEGYIKVRAKAEGETVRIGALRVRQVDSAGTANAASDKTPS